MTTHTHNKRTTRRAVHVDARLGIGSSSDYPCNPYLSDTCNITNPWDGTGSCTWDVNQNCYFTVGGNYTCASLLAYDEDTVNSAVNDTFSMTKSCTTNHFTCYDKDSYGNQQDPALVCSTCSSDIDCNGFTSGAPPGTGYCLNGSCLAIYPG